MLRTVRATRYVTPLREGGSLPAIVEADDDGLYVLKFRGAGQGPLALVAELVAGEMGRMLGLNVPELVFVHVDSALGRNEPDEEIQDLLQASVGLNLALDYLPGAVMFDRAAGDGAEADLASAAVWFDAFVMNVDRTVSNPNLLYWHKQLYFIDHGAALYFHHDWPSAEQAVHSRFPAVKRHVLLQWASRMRQADEAMRSKVDLDGIAQIMADVPQEWMTAASAGEYVRFFERRLAASSAFVEEAMRARSELI